MMHVVELSKASVTQEEQHHHLSRQISVMRL